MAMPSLSRWGTVADSAATGHFFPNENNRKNDPNQIEV
jgi:hypothetical protein